MLLAGTVSGWRNASAPILAQINLDDLLR